eukprot:gene16385-6457_t
MSGATTDLGVHFANSLRGVPGATSKLLKTATNMTTFIAGGFAATACVSLVGSAAFHDQLLYVPAALMALGGVAVLLRPNSK